MKRHTINAGIPLSLADAFGVMVVAFTPILGSSSIVLTLAAERAGVSTPAGLYGTGLAVAIVTSFVVAWAFALIVRNRWNARSGYIEIDFNGFVIDHTRSVPIASIESFRDDSADFVELLLASGSRVTIPTPTETDRVAVLAFLTVHGARRAP